MQDTITVTIPRPTAVAPCLRGVALCFDTLTHIEAAGNAIRAALCAAPVVIPPYHHLGAEAEL